MDVVNYLLGYENLKILQNKKSFNVSLDSVLLANFVTINKTIKNVIDIGTGNAPIPLILSTRTKALIIGVEIQQKIFDLAVKTVEMNNLENQITIKNADIMSLYNEIESDSVDTITCNPPYFKVNKFSRLNDNEEKTLARHEVTLDINRLMTVAKKILKTNGNIAIVHRPERLIDIITIMKENSIEPKRIQLVHPKMGKPANILLIEGTKNGRPGVEIMHPLYAHLENGEYTEEIKKYFR